MRTMNRQIIYILSNFAFAAATLVGFAMHPGLANPIYVILLFAICTTPIVEATAVNGPYSLLILWSLDYFLMYGALDFQHLMFGSDSVLPESEILLSPTELAILLGGALAQIAYRLACRAASRGTSHRAPKNWSELTLVTVGIGMWIVSSALNWRLGVDLMVLQKNAASPSSTLDDLGGVQIGIFMIARMAQPLSILILAYAQCRFKRPYMLPIVLGVTLYQLFYGFVVDTKSDAIIGVILVVLTNFTVTGRIPKGWLALMGVLLITAFPILQANRVVRDEHNLNSAKASENLGAVLQQALEATTRVNTGHERAQSALERLTAKGSVEMIVQGIGKNHDFQNGYTLMPMVTAFIPRLIWPGKPSIQTGQILNKEFHVSEDAETFISPSHLGELYWNFGWVGVLVGMSLVGSLLGLLGARFNLVEAPTITRLMVIIVTIRLLILASEGEFAIQYVVWMRSLLGIGLLHLLFARVPWKSRGEPKPVPDAPLITDRPRPVLFPNLLR
jgi:hypothetical protein